ncbi:MAG: diguanylate cyclase [Ruthenibacterium sp.]
MKLRRILIREIIGVSCLLALALMLGLYGEMRAHSKQQTVAPLQMMAERCQSDVSALLQTGISCAKRVADSGEAVNALLSADQENVATTVVEMSAAARDALPVLLVNLQGRILSASEMSLNGLNLAMNADELAALCSTGLAITPRIAALYPNAPPSVSVVSPVRHGGRRIGYALVRLDAALFDACVQGITAPENSVLVLFDSAGQIVSSTACTEYTCLSELFHQSDFSAKKSESEVFLLQMQRKKMMAAYRVVEQVHWNILCANDYAALGAMGWWLLLPVGTVALFAVLLCVLLNAVLQHTYTQPMGALRESIRQIEAGDYSHSVPYLGRTELGEVGTAFNGMLERIRRDHRELSVKEARYRILNEQTNSIIFEHDIETGEVQCSPNGRMLENYPACLQNFPEHMLVQQGESAREGKTLSQLFCEMKRGRVNGEMDLQLRTYNSSLCWFHLQLSVITDEVSLKPLRVVGKLTDIDAEKREAQNLAFLAERDALTSLYNKAATRTAIVQRLAERGSHMSALMIADVDNFKHVNDDYGHQKGDTVLVAVAAELRRCVGEDNVAGRMGGDEFMLWLDNVESRDEVQRVAQSICAAMEKIPLNETTGETISVSMGIALCPQDGITYQQLYAHADNVLYAVKRGGKNNFAFYRDEE